MLFHVHNCLNFKHAKTWETLINAVMHVGVSGHDLPVYTVNAACQSANESRALSICSQGCQWCRLLWSSV